MDSLFKNKRALITWTGALLLATALVVIAFMASALAEQKQQLAGYAEKEIHFNKLASAQLKELERHMANEALLNAQIKDFKEALWDAERKRDMLHAEPHDIILNRYMPWGALELFNTFVAAIATGDEALYRSLLSDDIPDVWSSDMGLELYHGYLMVPFEQHNGTHFTIRRIETSNPFRGSQDEINRLQGIEGWYHARLIVEDDAGNLVEIWDIGVAYNHNTGRWEINDYH